MLPRLRSLLWPLGLVLLLLPLGCNNPFKPADPEPPNGLAIPEDFKSIEGVLSTIAVAIEAKSASGADAYIHAMADSTATGDHAFRAFYDPGVRNAWLNTSNGQTAPEPWNLALERGLCTQLSGIRQNDPYLFVWSPDPGSPADQNIPNTDVWSIHRHYELKAQPATGDAVTIVAGFADLLLVFDSPNYRIFEWHDRVDPKYGVNPPNFERTFSFERLESQ